MKTILFCAATMFSLASGLTVQAAEDVLLQTMNGRIVTGVIDDATQLGTLGTRVYGGSFQLNASTGEFRSSNPGFFALRSGDVKMPAGASGFPSQHDVSFDLLPMTVGGIVSTLLYWDGSDLGGSGLDVSDVHFVRPTDIYWDVFDANFAQFTAAGSDALVPGGVIQRTSLDVWPDGFNSGTIHRHLPLQVRDADGNSTTTAPQGIYLIAWQARSVGFENSEPFYFVHRTPLVSDAVRDVAASWVEANVDELIKASGALSGDYNGDGVVDGADFVVWQAAFSKGINAWADGNQNEGIDVEDYAHWSQHFGQFSEGSGQGAAVPEPAGGLLIVLGFSGLSAVRWRIRRGCSIYFGHRVYSTSVEKLRIEVT